MAMDVDKFRKKLKNNTPSFNMVPFIDILFTLLIFMVVATGMQTADMSDSNSGKPIQSESSGPSEYYLIPVAGLTNVTVNGQDMSYLIKDSSITVHTNVIDSGEIIIQPKKGKIIITTPVGMPVEKAVKMPA
jgi:biopolymer transport protein ExbD